MSTGWEPQNEHSEERPEIHRTDDGGRQPEAGNLVQEKRGIERADAQEGSQGNVPNGSDESTDLRERDAMLCPAVPCSGNASTSLDAGRGDASAAPETNSLIVDMNLLDVRIRIETILQDEAKYYWQDLPLVVRNEYAKMYESGNATFDIARQFCDDYCFSPVLCHDIYKERNQLC